MLMDYLKKLAGVRRERRGSAAAVYWNACADLANGREPRAKAEALAEALDDLRRSEQDLADDARLVAEHHAATERASRRDAVRSRLRAAGAALAAADQKAAELIDEARRIRAEAQAAVDAANAEQTAVQRATEQVRQLARRLAQRGEPSAVEAAADAELQRRTDSASTDLRVAQQELAEVEAFEADAQAIVDQADAGKFAVADDKLQAARSTLGEIELRRARRDRLAARLAAVQAGGDPDAGTIEPTNDVDPAFEAEAVTP